MKLKYALMLFSSGYLMEFISALFKIQHWPGASVLLTIAMTVKLVAILIITFKFIFNPAFRDLLNR